jgi:hypothetical protein
VQGASPLGWNFHCPRLFLLVIPFMTFHPEHVVFFFLALAKGRIVIFGKEFYLSRI